MTRSARGLLAFLVLTALSPLARAAEGPLPVSLFNGKDLSGWTFFLVDPKVKMEDVWSVRDGLLVCKGEPLGYLATPRNVHELPPGRRVALGARQRGRTWQGAEQRRPAPHQR